MSYTYSLQEKEGFVRLDIRGSSSPGQEAEDVIELWRRLADACGDKDITRFLAVWNISGRMPVMRAYELVSSADDVGWERRFKLANVHPHEEIFQDNQFTETLAVNRGYHIRMFRDEKTAESWLLGSESRPLTEQAFAPEPPLTADP